MQQSYGGDKDIVEILVKYGAQDLGHALHGACMEGNLDVVKVLVVNGAPVEEVESGCAPIHIAAQYNNSDVIRYLVEKAGCNPDIVS